MKILSIRDIRKLLPVGTIVQVTHSAKGAYPTERLRRIFAVTSTDIILTAVDNAYNISNATLEGVVARSPEEDVFEVVDRQGRRLARWVVRGRALVDGQHPWIAVAQEGKAKPGEHVGQRPHQLLKTEQELVNFGPGFDFFEHGINGWLGKRVVLEDRPLDDHPISGGEHECVKDAIWEAIGGT